MTQQEQARLQVLNSLLTGHMTTEQAATLMGVSTRHTRRILAAYRKDGAAAIAHGNRGRRPANATPETMTTHVVDLARTRYAGVNHTHLSELLGEREGIDIGRNSLRKILTDAGVNSPRRRRPPKHRVRRQRMARAGMLIQIDGSYHRWLGEDGPQFTLLLAVDDATGCVVNSLFCELENTRSYLLLMRDLIQSYGIPIALYSDRHGVFKHTPPSETASAPTQFSRAMGELGVQLIFARSPQAKGRVERAAGTLQDRLVTELRLARATTIDDANRVLDDFLPRFNERFWCAVAACRDRVSGPGAGDVPGHCPMSEVQAQGWQGQHGEVPLAHPTAASRHRPTELCRIGGGCARRAGRTTGSATRRAYRRLPGSAAPSEYPAQLRHEDRTHDCPQPPHQRCRHKTGGRGGDSGHNAPSGQPPRRCRPQRRRKSSQDRDIAIQKAHSTSGGEMEGGAEGETQGTVHSWYRPRAGHTQRDREEVHQCRESTCVACSNNVGSIVIC